MTITQWLLLPIFIHVALTTWVGVRTITARIASVKAGKSRIRDISLNTKAWPDEVLKLGNNFDNQFEVPLMWYACCGLLVATGLADIVSVVLSWAFVLARIVHALIHTGSNDVPKRMKAFLAGFTFMALLWLWFGFRLFAIG
jgi:hypothetical protein